ncbi:trihelix transcription factor ASIL2 [Malania oleifera]|uniref:trihelix transcription factor ASIL2 n=1 Tax=Malania oleifera TaxID=397392 RepID=UPI0025AEB9C2|nr:trihelix transcription factor ASIL2 [Malania oleifera]
MEKQSNQRQQQQQQQAQPPSLLLPNPATSTAAAAAKHEDYSSPKKPPLGGGGGGDRLKRDEWSEGAVSSLLEAYETKWVLRNRAKLKGHDWEDVARHVSSRSNSTKSPKTQTQCKNKIESMKKRYRSESATADPSSWPLFPRLDLLLRGTAPPLIPTLPPPPAPPLAEPSPAAPPPVTAVNPPLVLLEPSPQPPPAVPPPPPPPPPHGTAQNSHESAGGDRVVLKEDGEGTKVSIHASEQKIPMDTDSSTPALYCSDVPEKTKAQKMKTRMEKKRRRSRPEEDSSSWEIAESIRWLAEVVVRSEQARMDTMRELERMRIEAEAKRAEMDLKRTEIIANTQLEIARLFAAGAGKSVDSSLRIGRN